MFVNMMDEVNYRVVRGLLLAKANTEIKQVEIDINDLQSIGAAPQSPTTHPLMRQNQ